MGKKKAIVSWSGGKDSALAFYHILQEQEYEVVALLTTMNEEFNRVSMHGVRRELIEAQANALGMPLEIVWVPKVTTNEEYENRMRDLLIKYKSQGVETVIFGDIFLEDLKKYREDNLKKLDMHAVFPLWKRDTTQIVNEFLQLGFGTVICCSNNDYFTDNVVGEVLSPQLIQSFPKQVDPCGENGEFHTFVFEGPVFINPIRYKVGEKVVKTYEAKCMINGKEQIQTKGFWFADLLLDK